MASVLYLSARLSASLMSVCLSVRLFSNVNSGNAASERFDLSVRGSIQLSNNGHIPFEVQQCNVINGKIGLIGFTY